MPSLKAGAIVHLPATQPRPPPWPARRVPRARRAARGVTAEPAARPLSCPAVGPRRSHRSTAQARGPGGDNAVIARAAHPRSDARLHQAGERARDPLLVPADGARDRSSTRQGAPPFVRGVPEGQSARLPIIRADYRATLRRPGAKSRGTRHAPCRTSRSWSPSPCTALDGRDALGPTWTAGHKQPQATCRLGPLQGRPLDCVARARPVIPRHTGQRASFAQARGVGGWRAGVAAGRTAAPRRAASRAGPAQKRMTPRSRASCRPSSTSRAMAAASVRSRRARPRTGTSGARIAAHPAPRVTGRGRARQSHGARRRAWRPACWSSCPSARRMTGPPGARLCMGSAAYAFSTCPPGPAMKVGLALRPSR
jgi:hypothetical protein